ncbi:hypothetical protein ACUTG2_27405, partial [Klebsiella aerogenes]|uniref:hypothetical protein n=1 Tax=Klebsiella aerogenes TaxID=548 RepID=UPI00404445F5
VAPVSAAPPGKMAARLAAKHKNKRPSLSTEPFVLFDAWQFMAGVLPATLRAVAAQRSNPLPADLSCSGERSPTNNR